MASTRIEMDPEACVICQESEPAEELSQIRSKGLKTLKEYCHIRKNTVLLKYLEEQEAITIPNKVLVHKGCRRDFTNPLRRSIELDQSSRNESSAIAKMAVLRRSDCQSFDWKSCCIFCGDVLVIDKKHPDRNKPIHKVGVLLSKDTILKKCEERGDKWASDVSRRLAVCIDLVASDAVYHGQ